MLFTAVIVFVRWSANRFVNWSLDPYFTWDYSHNLVSSLPCFLEHTPPRLPVG